MPKSIRVEPEWRRIAGAPARAAGFAIVLLLLFGTAAARVPATRAITWTATSPPIDLTHIETGEINRRGEAVGYHHRPNGVDPAAAKVLRLTQPPDANGVYRARVALHDPQTGEWVDKIASSTFFPDAMSTDAVIQSVLAAFHNGRRRSDGEFIGASGHGFMIEGWYQGGRIMAAYPLRGP